MISTRARVHVVTIRHDEHAEVRDGDDTGKYAALELWRKVFVFCWSAFSRKTDFPCLCLTTTFFISIADERHEVVGK